MLNSIKSFGKVQFEEDNFFLGGLTLVYVLTCPRKAVVDRSPAEKTVLVTMNNFQDNLLEAVGQEFGNPFKTTIE